MQVGILTQPTSDAPFHPIGLAPRPVTDWSHGKTTKILIRLPGLRGDLDTLGRASASPAASGNSIAEEANVAAVPGSGMTRAIKGRSVTLETLDVRTEEAPRIPTGIAELDRVTGGGIVPGSAILIGGEPGIGKSTLLLQLSASLANAGRSAVYFLR